MPNRPPSVETLNYRQGGFHPVHLNDTFKSGRYEIIHKLGHGGFATVWLGRDSHRQRYVALKILAARLSRDCPEVEILRRLRNSEDVGGGKQYVMSMLDHFWIKGPNGDHLCVVSEVGGPSIKLFNESPGLVRGTRRLKAIVARRVALEAVEGLAFIHSTGTVHGDFTAANILLQLANIDEWTIDEIHDRLGAPQTQELRRTTKEMEISSPRYTVNAISMRLVDPKWLSDAIMIIDFGIAFLEEQGSHDIGTPKNYCAPEFQFGRPRSKASDLWALGCTIFEIRTGYCLFLFHGPPDRDHILIELVKTLGSLPEDWWKHWENGRRWYEHESKPGGQLADMVKGNLAAQIEAMGLHDGDKKPSHLAHKDMGFKKDVLKTIEEKLPSPSERHQTQTDQLIALVEELTTSEAAEVMAQVNRNSGSSQEKSQEKTGSVSSPRNDSGSASSNNKSGEMSSEGIATEPSTVRSEEHTVNGQAGLPGLSFAVKEYLESTGTTISQREAEMLEDLLRKTMKFVPEERVAAIELVKHDWFIDTYETMGRS